MRKSSIFFGLLALAVLWMPAAAGAQALGSLGQSMMEAGNPIGTALQSVDNNHRGGPAPKLTETIKKELTDADPRVRADTVDKLRYINDPHVNHLLMRAYADPDVRVRIQAIDVLGARHVEQAVPAMAQGLFLRGTPAIEKLHLVAALGRIGDSKGTLPILQYLQQATAERSRGTAIFALGEIGDPRATSALVQIISGDPSEDVRRLAREALEKIDGELPTRRSQEAIAARDKQFEPTDVKLAKMREMDERLQQEGR